MKTLRVLTFVTICFTVTSANADWQTVEPSTYPVTIETSGIVVSKHVQKFTPPVGFMWNRTISFIAREGQRVRKGELVVGFDGSYEDERLRNATRELQQKQTELNALVEQYTQAIEKEKLDLADAESKADKARRKAEQPVELLPSIEYQKLVEQRKIAEKIAAQLSRRAEAAARERETRQRALEVAVERLKNKQLAAQKDVATTKLFATDDGLVVIGTGFDRKKFDVGSTTQPGSVVLELVDDASFEVHATASEAQAAKLAVGQTVRMTAETSGGQEFSGKIVTLGNTVRRRSMNSQEMVREFTVELADHGVALKLGVPVKVVVEVSARANALAVPIESLVYREGLPGLMTRNGWQRVTLGERSNGKVIVESGIDKATVVQI